MGSLVSNLAKLNLSGVAEDANDKHVPGFTELCHVRQATRHTHPDYIHIFLASQPSPVSLICLSLIQKHSILNTPITPYIDKELLSDNHLDADGTRITKDTSFRYEHQVSREKVKEQVVSFIEQKVFPTSHQGMSAEKTQKLRGCQIYYMKKNTHTLFERITKGEYSYCIRL